MNTYIKNIADINKKIRNLANQSNKNSEYINSMCSILGDCDDIGFEESIKDLMETFPQFLKFLNIVNDKQIDDLFNDEFFETFDKKIKSTLNEIDKRNSEIVSLYEERAKNVSKYNMENIDNIFVVDPNKIQHNKIHKIINEIKSLKENTDLNIVSIKNKNDIYIIKNSKEEIQRVIKSNSKYLKFALNDDSFKSVFKNLYKVSDLLYYEGKVYRYNEIMPEDIIDNKNNKKIKP